MRKRFLKTAVTSLILCCLVLIGLANTFSSNAIMPEEEIEVEVAIEKTQSHQNNTQLVKMLLGTEEAFVNNKILRIQKEESFVEGVYLTQEEINILYEKEQVLLTPVSTNYYGLTDDQIDMVANVVMHEVGGLYGSGVTILVTYANGTSIDYSGTDIIHKIHAQVLLNQYNSSLFPSSLSKCISQYWANYLTNTNYYSHNNSQRHINIY